MITFKCVSCSPAESGLKPDLSHFSLDSALNKGPKILAVATRGR